MVLGKIWRAFMAQINKLANFFWTQDPIAQMQYEYDMAVEQMKEGREGLEIYRALVERLQRQVRQGEKKEQTLTAKIKAYLQAGERKMAGHLAIELERARQDLSENREQMGMHEQAYQNNLAKIKHASKKLAEVQGKIQKYDAELRMSAAEAEVARLAETFEFNVTTDFGQIEAVVQGQIDKHRATARVAADLSSRGVGEIEAEQRMEETLAEDLLSQFEVEMGLKTAETAGIKPAAKELGPAREGGAPKKEITQEGES